MNTKSMKQAVWYFDFISPYSYLQFRQLERLPAHLELAFKPVLFAGLLKHWGQVGPAEIPWKRVNMHRQLRWRAHRLGIQYQAPARHPFNPLALLRLSIALGNTGKVVDTIYHHVWGQGNDGQSEDSLKQLAGRLGVDDIHALISHDDCKKQLRANTEEAAKKGVFGVPTFEIEDQLFWGDDMFEYMLEWLDDPSLIGADDTRSLLDFPAAAQRRK